MFYQQIQFLEYELFAYLSMYDSSTLDFTTRRLYTWSIYVGPI